MAFLYFRWVSDFFEVLRVQNPYAAASVQLNKAMKPQAGQVDSALILCDSQLFSPARAIEIRLGLSFRPFQLLITALLSALALASALPNFAQNNPQAAMQGQRTSPLKGMRPLQRYSI